MFRRLGRVITGYAPVIIIVILLISMGFALVIPRVEFKTNLNRFLPDNELVRANERVSDYFGDDSVVHFIYVEEENTDSDILTPWALEEQYDIYRRCKASANVVNVVSIASIFDELVPFIYPDKSFLELEPENITFIKEQFFKILNGSIDISLINLMLNTSYTITLEELRQLVDLFFDKDFDYNSAEPKAKSTLILVFIDGSLSASELKDISKNLRETISSEEYSQITVSHTGGFLVSSDLDKASSESFSLLGIVIIILIAVILSLSFRRVSYVLIPLLTLGLAIVWTFGTMLLLDIEFTIITVAIIPLIIGLGVDYSVYISKRYQEELHKGKNISKALENSIGSVGTAMFLAVLTTIIAFMSNLSSSIAPIREFGLVCGLGIFYAFILTLTFHTSTRWLVDMKSSKSPQIGKEKELYVIELGTQTASHSVVYYPILVLIIVIVITLGAVTFAMNVRTEFNNADFLPNDWESLQTQQAIESSFNGSSFSQVYVLLESTDENGAVGAGDLISVETLEGIRELEDNIGNDKYVARIAGEPRIESVLTHVKAALDGNSTLASLVDANNDGLPDDDEDVKTVYDYMFSSDYIDRDSSQDVILLLRSDIDKILYRDSNGNYQATVIRIYVTTEDSNDVRKMYDELKDDVEAVRFLDVDKSATGNVILTVTTMDSLQDSQILSTVIAVLFALVILIIIYRNLALGLIAITPVLLSSVWILGTMYILGISINVFTVSITALTIGLGIDYAIHIIERFREEHKRFEAKLAVQRTIRSTGTALFISGLTTVCGFIVLTISPIPPIQHFGIITAMTIVYSSILALVVIPVLLLRWARPVEEKRKLHSG